MTGKLHVSDIRAAGICMSGTRTKCRELDLDFRALVKVGLPLEQVEKIEDPHVQRCVAFAKERIAGNG